MTFKSVPTRNVGYRVLTEDQCGEIYGATLRILARTGCNVNDEEGLQLLRDAGCYVDGNLVKIPAALTEWAIASAPSSIVLYDRNGEPAMNLSPWNSYMGPAITATKTVDVQTGQARTSVTQDAVNNAIVLDALPNFSFVSAMNSASDATTGLDDLFELGAVLKNSAKPVMFWSHGTKNLSRAFEMFETIAGGEEEFRSKPFAFNLICPIDPLVHTKEGVSQIIYMAKKGAPSFYVPGVGIGLSGPVTLAGTLAVGLADTLVGLVISQLVRKGAPFIASKFSDNFDMRTTNISQSRPERILDQNATADMFRYIGLPFCINIGSDSSSFDQMNVFDKTMQIYSGYLSGANLICGAGFSGTGILTDLAELVFCDEAASFIDVLVNGLQVTDETIAEDVIDEVGPGENFLTEEHTVEHMRDLWNPVLLRPSDTPMPDAYNQRVKEILAAGPGRPLKADLAAKIDQILNEAVAEISA